MNSLNRTPRACSSGTRLYLFFSTVVAMCLFLLVLSCGGGKATTYAEEPRPVSLLELSNSPKMFKGRPIRVRGFLENQGSDFFTDLKLVLTDKKGNQVLVESWLPLEVPPMPPGREVERPAVLSDYLSQEMELTGQLLQGPFGQLEKVYYLQVRSAKLIR